MKAWSPAGILIILVGLLITGFIMVVFTPLFRESGASFNATPGIGNFYGMTDISTAWPLIMWAVPVCVIAAVIFAEVRERMKH